MPPKLEAIDPLAEPGWDNLVATHSAGSFVHTAAWARVLSSSYGYRPFYFVAVKDRCLQGLIPVMEIRSRITGYRGVSLPFTDECDLILPEGMAFEEAVKAVKVFARSRRWKTLELRGSVQGMEGIPASSEYYAHDLALSPAEGTIFPGFRENVQRNIRKANKKGVVIDKEGSQEGIREFYRLNCMTRRDHGLPPQPFRFFESLWTHILSAGKGTLFLARYEEHPIAGAVFLHHGQKVIFKYGASDSRFQHLRANNLVMWEAIRSYGEQGFRELSFGRTDTDHAGLCHFKRSWGCTQKVLRYFRFGIGPESWLPGRKRDPILLKKVFSRLPLPVLRAVGTVAYGHIG